MEENALERDERAVAGATHRGDDVTVLGPGTPRLLMLVPGAFTPVCDGELRTLSDLAMRAQQLDVQLLVVSCDTPATLAAWLDRSDLSGEVIGISDHWPHGRIARRLHSFNEKTGTALRRSWAIRPDGTRKLAASSGPGEPRQMRDHLHGLEWAASTL